MKRYKVLTSLLMLVALLGACTKQSTDLTLSKGVAPELLTPEADLEYVLKAENADNPFETFIYTAADYGWPIVVKYTLEMDVEGGDFSAPTEVKSFSNGLYQTISVADFNLKLGAMGLTPEEQSIVQLRVKANAENPDVEVLYSNVVELKVTPFDAAIPPIYAVGAATEAGWDPSSAVAVPAEEMDIFRGELVLTGGEDWRFLGQNSGWGPVNYQWKDFDEHMIEPAGAIEAAPENEYGEVNFHQVESGTFLIEVNLKTKTFKAIKQ